MSDSDGPQPLSRETRSLSQAELLCHPPQRPPQPALLGLPNTFPMQDTSCQQPRFPTPCPVTPATVCPPAGPEAETPCCLPMVRSPHHWASGISFEVRRGPGLSVPKQAGWGAFGREQPKANTLPFPRWTQRPVAADPPQTVQYHTQTL